jgi:hypothetical protein
MGKCRLGCMDISKNFLFHYSVTALNKILIISQRNVYLRSEVNPLRRIPLALRVPPLRRLRRSCQPGVCKNLPAG